MRHLIQALETIKILILCNIFFLYTNILELSLNEAKIIHVSYLTSTDMLTYNVLICNKFKLKLENLYWVVNIDSYIITIIICDSGMWASQIRVVDMGTSGGAPTTLAQLALEQNEAAVSACIVRWATQAHSSPHLVVGVAKDLILSPRSCTEGSLHVYKVTDNTILYT